MASGRPVKSSLSPLALHHILKLGEDLVSIAHEAYHVKISPSVILARQCDEIIGSVARLFNGDAQLGLTGEVLESHKENKGGFLTQSGKARLRITPLMQVCMEQERVVVSGTDQTFSNSPAEPAQVADTPEISAAAPLILRNIHAGATTLLGAIQIDRNPTSPFTEEEIHLLEGLAIQSALILQTNLRLTNERWQREQLDLVRQVSLQIANLRDLDEIALRVTELISETFHYYCTSIFTLEPDQQVLRFRASAGSAQPTTEALEKAFDTLKLGEGIVGFVAQSGQELLARDVRNEPRYRHLEILPETRSEIALPLIAQDQILGVLDVQSDQPDDLDEMDLLVLRTLAGNIAIAIEDARLYQDLRRRAVHLQTVYEVSSAITSILDQESLLSEVVKLIQERFGHPYVHIFSVHPGRRKIFYEAGSGLRSQSIDKEEYTYDLDDPVGLIPWVARTGETALVNDVRSDARYRPSKLPPEGTLSELTVALVFGGSILGILDIQSDRLNAFTKDDRFLFEALADHIAIALRNAYLYRSEVWRRGVADSLREVAGILSADVGLDHVLEAVLLELEHTLPLDAAAIWLMDDASMEETSELPPSLHLACVHGEGTTSLDLEIGLQPEEILRYNLDLPEEQELSRASSWLLEALYSDDPVIRSADSPAEPIGAALNFPPDYSAIGAPLRIGQHLLGVLCLVHQTAGRYGSEAQAMTAAFASYAAVAIENARLYEDAHEQAWVSTVLLQVANATQSINNLPELLDTVIRITPMLTGVKACLFYILDEDGAFVPAAVTGLSSEQQSEFERWRFAPGDVPALDRLVEERNPVILHLEEEDQRIASILVPENSADSPLEIGLPVLVPLIARGEMLGTLLVAYTTSLPTLSLGKSFEAFFDERLAILQGIAHQTAIAIDNIRLLKSQKEEAYVSVALLQVAQAVVSSNDLEEALGSIVRITPILVGVKRAAIYLWNEDQNLFQLSQTYGLPRNADLETVRLGEFPMLDAVLVEDTPLALPAPVDVDEDNPINVWANLDAPDLSAVEYFLMEEACLLIAFPLSVKGRVMGVFLVEEPDPVPGEGYSSGNANRRLRPKRMEIITGISQQAALAIQNDQLQKETLERERLEREMQLAREIQEAFLPQRMPELPGWELQAYWRPAREVGGDFYDFFELPGGRLGLVIADVADKGMPAALVMTLVRTLVRATVQVLDSPSEVLERVNDLLVPDSPSGMFVTLAYAVLDLKSGEIRIANAGHNPPLVLHLPCRFEHARRGGMALGVEAGSQIQEQRYQIEPGGLLVMYTDGVTESFSSEGEMFGEEHLLAAIQEVAMCEREDIGPGAGAILEAIDQKVIEFTGETVPYDDLTLVVLKRSPDVGGARPAI